jgi:hypothetical protein
MVASRAGVGSVVVFGYWQTQTGTPTTAPGNGKYQADSWSAPTLLAISTTDSDGYTRDFTNVSPGDIIIQLASNNSQNYQRWLINSVTLMGTWVQIAVQVVESGTAFAAPGSNQSRLIELIQEPPDIVTAPSTGLPSLATPDDIVARLGRNLDQTEAARVDAMLKDGSAIIRRYAREDFVYVSGDLLKVKADAGTITIPKVPVVSVDGLTAESGNPMIPNLLITWYFFDGIDTIMVPDPHVAGIINLAEWWYDTEWSTQPFLLKWTHGYTYVPPEVNGLLCNAIISELSTPTLSATVQSESIGAYSYSMRRRAIGGGLYATLTDFGMQSLLADYRKSTGTIATRF